MRRRTFVMSLSMAALVVVRVEAQGEIPIYQPTNITASGSYIVTRDITTSNVDVININNLSGGSVDLDLNGFTLTRTGAGGQVIKIASSVSSLTIRNGRVSGGQFGIESNLPGQGIGKIIIEDVEIVGGASGGIHLFDVVNFTIRRCVIFSWGSGPAINIAPSGAIAAASGTIENNLIRGPGDAGVVVSNASVALLNNRIIFAGPGIHLSQARGSVVAGNTIRESSGRGIFVSGTSAITISGNVINQSGTEGIEIAASVSDALVVDNVINGSGRHGLLMSGVRSLIDRNSLSGNNGAGLFLNAGATADNVFARNVARQNGGASLPGCAFLFPPNSCSTSASNTSGGGNFIPGAF